MDLDEEIVSGINLALHEAHVSGLRMREDLSAVELLVLVQTLPEEGPIDPDGRRVVVLAAPSRIRILLRRDRRGEPRYGPALPLHDVSEVGQFFISHLTWADAMYGWPFLDGAEHASDEWPEPVSLDLELPRGDDDHSLYWFAECGRNTGDEVLSYFIQGIVWFGSIEVLRANGHEVALDDFGAGARRWWSAFRDRDDRVNPAAQHAAQEGPVWQPWQRHRE
jgi:hypothetical protein